MKRTNIHIMGMPKRKQREKETERIFEEIMNGKVINLVKKISHPRNSTNFYKINLERFTPTYIITKLLRLHQITQSNHHV